MDQILASQYANQNMVRITEDVVKIALTAIQAKHLYYLFDIQRDQHSLRHVRILGDISSRRSFDSYTMHSTF